MATARKQNNKVITQMAIDQAVILTTLTNVERRIDSIDDKLEKNYVSQDQFAPVKNIVYGMVSVILVAVIGAIIALVINK